MLFYPKCSCGGAVVSAEPDYIEQGGQSAGRWLQSQSIQGHKHPVLQVAVLGLMMGREVWKRTHGLKRCTACTKTFY